MTSEGSSSDLNQFREKIKGMSDAELLALSTALKRHAKTYFEELLVIQEQLAENEKGRVTGKRKK